MPEETLLYPTSTLQFESRTSPVEGFPNVNKTVNVLQQLFVSKDGKLKQWFDIPVVEQQKEEQT